jgi:hypothetical protein
MNDRPMSRLELVITVVVLVVFTAVLVLAVLL